MRRKHVLNRNEQHWKVLNDVQTQLNNWKWRSKPNESKHFPCSIQMNKREFIQLSCGFGNFLEQNRSLIWMKMVDFLPFCWRVFFAVFSLCCRKCFERRTIKSEIFHLPSAFYLAGVNEVDCNYIQSTPHWYRERASIVEKVHVQKLIIHNKPKALKLHAFKMGMWPLFHPQTKRQLIDTIDIITVCVYFLSPRFPCIFYNYLLIYRQSEKSVSIDFHQIPLIFISKETFISVCSSFTVKQ